MSQWIIWYGVFWLAYFYLFGMQRATLLISRTSDVEWKSGGALLLPEWYPLTWIVVIARWVILIAMALYWRWDVALWLLIGSFVLSAVLPIPYSVYGGVFRNRVSKIKNGGDTYTATRLQIMLDKSGF